MTTMTEANISCSLQACRQACSQPCLPSTIPCRLCHWWKCNHLSKLFLLADCLQCHQRWASGLGPVSWLPSYSTSTSVTWQLGSVTASTVSLDLRNYVSGASPRAMKTHQSSLLLQDKYWITLMAICAAAVTDTASNALKLSAQTETSRNQLFAVSMRARAILRL